MYCPKCGKPIPDGSPVCPECLQPLTDMAISPAAENTAPDLPMKWYKFLIFFALWANAILNILTGITHLSGMTYAAAGVTAKEVYAYFGQGLHVLDIAMGVIMIALGVFSIIVRFQLAGYKKQGPKMLLVLYGVSLVVSILYSIIASAMTSVNVVDSSSISSLVVSVVMIFVNYIYFKKRAHLFCN